MENVFDTPGVHLVPAAIGMAADHAPEAHRWNDLPSLAHAQAPSLVHGPDCGPAAVEPPVEALGWLAGAAALVATAEAAGDGAIGETVAIEAIAGVVTAAAVADGAPTVANLSVAVLIVAKLPAETDAAVADETSAGRAPAAPQSSGLGGWRLVGEPPLLPRTTLLPGFGYRTSTPASITQSLMPLRLDTNISGSGLVSRLTGVVGSYRFFTADLS